MTILSFLDTSFQNVSLLLGREYAGWLWVWTPISWVAAKAELWLILAMNLCLYMQFSTLKNRFCIGIKFQMLCSSIHSTHVFIYIYINLCPFHIYPWRHCSTTQLYKSIYHLPSCRIHAFRVNRFFGWLWITWRSSFFFWGGSYLPPRVNSDWFGGQGFDSYTHYV